MTPFPNTLISPEALLAMAAAPPVLIDCSFDLADGNAGETTFAQAHLPGARYAHLERDLSGPKSARGSIDGGRHPLPTPQAFAATVAGWGVGPQTPVVVYDRQGATFAARAWWLLRWIGHAQVAVLDGGLPAWQAAGGTVESGSPPAPATPPGAAGVSVAQMPTVDAATLLNQPGRRTVIDARAGERYRGEVEPLDARAGHIPGARNRFFKDNLDASGRFKPAGELRATFQAFGTPPQQVVHQCGSGVTACHNLLAMEHAGLHGSALYPGSWSEWSADPARPVATGG